MDGSYILILNAEDNSLVLHLHTYIHVYVQARLKKKRPSCPSLHAQTQVHLPRLLSRPQLSMLRRSNQLQAVASQCRLPGVQVLKTSGSAPAQLMSNENGRDTKRPRHSSWRFVNRYKDRSNGGIPMFSEERSREREEKVRMVIV